MSSLVAMYALCERSARISKGKLCAPNGAIITYCHKILAKPQPHLIDFENTWRGREEVTNCG